MVACECLYIAAPLKLQVWIDLGILADWLDAERLNSRRAYSMLELLSSR